MQSITGFFKILGLSSMGLGISLLQGCYTSPQYRYTLPTDTTITKPPRNNQGQPITLIIEQQDAQGLHIRQSQKDAVKNIPIKVQVHYDAGTIKSRPYLSTEGLIPIPTVGYHYDSLEEDKEVQPIIKEGMMTYEFASNYDKKAYRKDTYPSHYQAMYIRLIPILNDNTKKALLDIAPEGFDDILINFSAQTQLLPQLKTYSVEFAKNSSMMGIPINLHTNIENIQLDFSPNHYPNDKVGLDYLFEGNYSELKDKTLAPTHIAPEKSLLISAPNNISLEFRQHWFNHHFFEYVRFTPFGSTYQEKFGDGYVQYVDGVPVSGIIYTYQKENGFRDSVQSGYMGRSVRSYDPKKRAEFVKRATPFRQLAPVKLNFASDELTIDAQANQMCEIYHTDGIADRRCRPMNNETKKILNDFMRQLNQ